MKNWRFKIVLAFFACLLFLGFNSFKVEAAEQTIGDDVVMFLGVIEETGTGGFKSVSAVSQKYYKSSGSSTPFKKSGYTSLSLNSICSLSDTNVTLSNYCNNGSLNPTLAYLMVDDTGNILVNLSNGVEIESLYIAYIIAGNNDNDDTKWLLKNNEIKEKAKKIQCDNSSSWLCLIYNNDTAKNAFSVNPLGAGGFNYRNFNIFNKMDATYKTVAREQGLYVAISLQVKYGTAVYKVNTSIVPSSGSSGFDKVDNNGSTSEAVINDSAGWVTTLSHVASLVAVDDTKSSGLENNEVYKRFNDVFKKYVRPIAIAVLGIMFIVTGSTTVLTIIRSSDEPEVRSSSIKHLVILFTSAVVIFLILIFYEPVISVVYGWFN